MLVGDLLALAVLTVPLNDIQGGAVGLVSKVKYPFTRFGARVRPFPSGRQDSHNYMPACS